MSEYIKREDVYERLVAHLPKHQERIEQILNDVPSIDIVKCKDCKYSEWFSDDPEDGGCNLLPLKVAINDYCSYGERKDER